MNALSAATQAQLNGTSPWTIISPGWAPEPNTGRGTMDIIWSCLVTIFACSWTVTHPDFLETKQWFSSKVLSCVVAVVAPEMMAYSAFAKYLNARHHLKVIKIMNKGQWTMSQLFFVGMGGVELEFEDCTEVLGCDDDGEFDNLKQALGNLQRALQLNILDIKSISVEDVEKRAKTNYVVKALVCLQASWLVFQTIGRAVAKLPITTLEVVTVGYVVCALISYCCWWHKPQDAEVHVTINCRRLTREGFHRQIEEVDEEPKSWGWWEEVLLCTTVCTFGAVHCIAWNFFFATFAESVTWRVASILTVVIPFLSASDILEHLMSDWGNAFNNMFVLTYVPIRLYLMVEPFVAFRSVPVGIFYTANWSSWIPHV